MTATHAAPPTVSTIWPAQPMTVTVDYGTLVDALSTTGLAVSATALPGINGVLLEGRGDHLVLTTTDTETAISVRVPDVHATGRLLIDHNETRDLLIAVAQGRRKHELDGMSVTVNAAAPDAPVVEIAGYRLPVTALPMDNVPPLPVAPPVVAQLDRENVTAEITRVLKAAGKDDTFPQIRGVHIEVNSGAVTLVATDRFRLAMATVPAVSTATDTTQGGALLPRDVLGKIIKRFSGDRLRIGWDRDEDSGGSDEAYPLVSLESGEITVITRASSGRFPAYRERLPTESLGTVVLHRAQLLSETQRAAAVLKAKKETAPVAVILDPVEIRIVPDLPDRGEEVITPGMVGDVEGIEEPLRYCFNHAYLIDALNSFTGDRITLHSTGSIHRPLMITDAPTGLTDTWAFRHLLMPMHQPG